MIINHFSAPDPALDEEEPSGAARYLQPGEDLRICARDIQIKKFRFEAYLTNRRLFLIDQNDRKPGITAKEVPVPSVICSYLEDSPLREPILVLSVRTSDDDIRTMKMVLAHTGEDRSREAEEWVHLLSQGSSGAEPERVTPPAPVIAPEARSLSDTMVFPITRTPERPAGREVQPEQPAPRPAPLVPAPPLSRPSSQSKPATSPGTSSQVTTPIVYCYHCGKKLPGNANFCPFCGTRVHESAVESLNRQHTPHPETRAPAPSSEQEPVKKRGWRRFFGR